MKNRTPGTPPAIPAFDPVPRKTARHDGWTPDRQRAFIEALADTGSVSRAAAMVNMTTVGAYYLRRQAGADGFRRAWEAALDYGVARMKDIAFERAVEGTLVPVIAGGKLLGYRRIYNDRLLMFCLRHYGEDAAGKRTRIEYFSTRASASAAANPPLPQAGEGRGEGLSGAQSQAEASATTVRTVITGKGADAPDLGRTGALIDGFAAAELDERARAEIAAILADCAARRRAAEGTADDEAELFLSVEQEPRPVLVYDEGYTHPRKAMRRPPPLSAVTVEPEHGLEPSPSEIVQPGDQYRSGKDEMPWQLLGDEEGMAMIERATAEVRAAVARRSATRANSEGAAQAPPKLPPPAGKGKTS